MGNSIVRHVARNVVDFVEECVCGEVEPRWLQIMCLLFIFHYHEKNKQKNLEIAITKCRDFYKLYLQFAIP